MPQERESMSIYSNSFVRCYCNILYFKSVIPIVSGDEAPLPLKAGVKPTFTERPTIRQTDEVLII